MKVVHFEYTRKDGEETKPQVMVLREDKTYMSGIDITKLKPEDVTDMFNIQREYEGRMKKYIDAAYRKYLKPQAKIISESKGDQ